MMMILTALGAAASLAAAVCGALCLRALRRGAARTDGTVRAEEPEEEPGDGELREGILNLLRYVPGGKAKEE